MKHHEPVHIGGRNAHTVICRCSWSSRTHPRRDPAWQEYRHHKKATQEKKP